MSGPSSNDYLDQFDLAIDDQNDGQQQYAVPHGQQQLQPQFLQHPQQPLHQPSQHHQPPQQLWSDAHQQQQMPNQHYPQQQDPHFIPPGSVISPNIHQGYLSQQQQAYHPVPQSSAGLPQVTVQNAKPIQTYSKKRRTRSSNAQSAPRKRTMMACESCRLKKVKCDLMKPLCGSCSKSGSTCMYRPNSSSSGDDADILTSMAGINGKHRPPQWSSCNWYAKGEGTLKWPIFEEKYKARAINTVLASKSDEGMPVFGYFTKSELDELNIDLKKNMEHYADYFMKNVSNKDPYINSKTLLRSVDYIKKQTILYPDIYLFDIHMPSDYLSLPVLIQCCAVGFMSKPLTFTNLRDFKTSTNEKSGVAEHAYRLHILASILCVIPQTKIPDFDLANVQFHLLQCMFSMYNMKPLKAWTSVFKASTAVMTILESYKSSGRSFTESEHRTLERVFHSCVKYESELRVELSPSVPSTGIVNYPFPSIYPTPPLDATLNPTEEASWFFYLTEIVLRKLENRFLDEFYVPVASSSDETGRGTGEFVEDNYSLDWGKFDVATIIEKITAYLEDLSKIENSIVTHLKPIMQDDSVTNELQPQGFVLKPVTTTPQSMSASTQNSQHQPQPTHTPSTPDEKPPLTPFSDTSSSNISQRAESVAPKVPEVINFIKTRMIAFKLLLFRPLTYLIFHDTVEDYENPFIDQVLSQSRETMDMINVPLATHRHFGSWFYVRNVFTGGMLVYGFYLRFKGKFAEKSKVEKVLRDGLVIFDYWLEEMADLEDLKRIFLSVLEDLKSV